MRSRSRGRSEAHRARLTPRGEASTARPRQGDWRNDSGTDDQHGEASTARPHLVERNSHSDSRHPRREHRSGYHPQRARSSSRRMFKERRRHRSDSRGESLPASTAASSQQPSAEVIDVSNELASLRGRPQVLQSTLRQRRHDQQGSEGARLQVCRNWRSGLCAYGTHCWFSHGAVRQEDLSDTVAATTYANTPTGSLATARNDHVALDAQLAEVDMQDHIQNAAAIPENAKTMFVDICCDPEESRRIQILPWFQEAPQLFQQFFAHCSSGFTLTGVTHLEEGAASLAFVPSTFMMCTTKVKLSMSLNSRGHLTLLEPEQLMTASLQGVADSQIPLAPVSIGAVINGLPTLHRIFGHESTAAGQEAVTVIDKVGWLDVLGNTVNC